MATEKVPRVLVTGCGGIGGINFINAIRNAYSFDPHPQFYVVGTDYNEFYIRLAEADVKLRSPKHSDPSFLGMIKAIVEKERIDFLHPNPSSEAKVIRQAVAAGSFDSIGTLMPSLEAIAPEKDRMKNMLRSGGVPAVEGIVVENQESLAEAFSRWGKPLWIRATEGAGARLSLKVNDLEEAGLWIELCIKQGRAKIRDFMIEPFLPGRDLAYDSLWFHGRLIGSSSRERIEYPLKHVSLTGLTGTPSVARTICDSTISDIGERAVLSIDRLPNGFYSVDLKEDERGNAFVTEVDGKWHTTGALWGLSLAKARKNNKFNIAYQYLLLGLGLKSELDGEVDLYGDEMYLIRQMDSGILLWDKSQDVSWRIA